MNILIINLDKGIFEKKSASLARLKDYSLMVDKIFVIVWTVVKEKPLVFDDKLFVFPTNSSNRLCYFLDSWLISRKIFKKEKIDLIVTQDPFETGLVGWFFSKIKNIPLQLQIHTDFLSPYFWKESLINKMRVVLAKFLIPRAKTLRVVSERIKKSVSDVIKFSSEKIFVLPIFVDIKKNINMPIDVDLHQKYSQFNFIILVASRLTKEKNIGLVIESMLRVIKKHPKVGLIIVGRGPEDVVLKAQVVKKNLQNNIIFEPWTDKIISYYKTADLFVLPSNYEGYGMSVVEALTVGCPIVMTDVGCARERILNLKNVFVVEVNNEEKLVEAIVSVLDNRSSVFKRGENLISYGQLGDFRDYLLSYKKTWEQTVV